MNFMRTEAFAYTIYRFIMLGEIECEQGKMIMVSLDDQLIVRRLLALDPGTD